MKVTVAFFAALSFAMLNVVSGCVVRVPHPDGEHARIGVNRIVIQRKAHRRGIADANLPLGYDQIGERGPGSRP